MLKYYVAFLFTLAALSGQAWAADVGHDCAEGSDEYVSSEDLKPPPPPPGS